MSLVIFSILFQDNCIKFDKEKKKLKGPDHHAVNLQEIEKGVFVLYFNIFLVQSSQADIMSFICLSSL